MNFHFLDNFHPVPFNEDARQKALSSFDILDTLPEESFDRVTALAASIFDVPIAIVSLIDRDRQWFKSCTGLSATETPRDVAFCAHAIMTEDVMVVPDATADRRFENNPLVTGEPYIRFYAGAPLIVSSGFVLGTLCLIDTKPRPDGLSPEEEENLVRLAAIVSREIEHRQDVRNRETRLDSELLEARRAKQEFLKMISHELRTPLNAVIGFSDVLKLQVDDERHKSYASDIGVAGRHLLQLIDGMIDWTRIERGELTLNEARHSLVGLIEKATVMAVDPDSRGRITVKAQPLSVNCDAKYMIQTLAHIIDNALKHSGPSDPVEIAVTAEKNGAATVSVTDMGVGMDRSSQRAALTPFEQLEEQATKCTAGIGLGLAISQRLTELHGGRLVLDSEVGRGTRVTLHLPGYRVRRLPE